MEDEAAVVDWKGLVEEFGVRPNARTTIGRWMKAGLFPRIINPEKHRNTHPLWLRREIRQHFKSRS
jgi:hypothetical protein